MKRPKTACYSRCHQPVVGLVYYNCLLWKINKQKAKKFAFLSGEPTSTYDFVRSFVVRPKNVRPKI